MPAFLILAAAPLAYAETVNQSMEGGMELSVTYPDSVVQGQQFPVSVLVENRGWEEKREIMLEFRSDSQISAQGPLEVGSIAEGGSHGATLNFSASGPPATYYINIDYSHILLENNETPRAPFSSDIAVPITVREGPRITVVTSTPESIFEGAEFPFGVNVTSDSELRNLEVQIVLPDGIEFRGQTHHTVYGVEAGQTISIDSRILTPAAVVSAESKLPFTVIISYKDTQGAESSESHTVQITLRPRAFMEITTEGGVWVGGVFIAPYVSLGTLVGIPAGALVTLLVRRRQGRSG